MRACPSCRPGWILLCGCLALSPTVGGASQPSATLAPSDTNAETRIVITIRSRQFDPAQIMLQAGRKTSLVLQNEDAELHTFVPGDFFSGVNVNIAGNGAPEFDERGFKRVIIPSEGWAEIRFVPNQTGVYPFFCDMPGHDMRATITVE